MFSLVNAVGGPVRLQCTEPEYTIVCHPRLLGGPDIRILVDCMDPGGRVQLLPTRESYTTCDPAFAVTTVTNSLLAGSQYNWSVGELEVFALEASG